MFALVGMALTGFTTLLLVALGLFGVMFGIAIVAVCWIPICVMVAAQNRWNEAAAWVLGGITAAGTAAAIITGFAAGPPGIDVMLIAGTLTFTWARLEHKAAKRRKLLAAIARQKAAQEARRAARAERMERLTSLVRKKGIEMPQQPGGGWGRLRKGLLSSVGELDRRFGHREHDVE